MATSEKEERAPEATSGSPAGELDVRLEDGEGNKLVILLRYNVIQRDVPGNQVLLEGVQQEVTL